MKNKKYPLFIILFMCLCYFLVGCNIQKPNMPVVQKKPNKFHYTSELYKSISSEEEFKVKLFEPNLHKELDVSREDGNTIKNFIQSLEEDNFVNSPEDLPSAPKYKLFITSKDEKYIINVYDDKLVTIYPWDGVFPMDYINMETMHKAYNLYGFCRYILNK